MNSFIIVAIIFIGAIVITLSMKLIRKLVAKLIVVGILSVLAYYIRSNPVAIINGVKGAIGYVILNGQRFLFWCVQFILASAREMMQYIESMI